MKCPKCSYERRPQDDAPDWQCPSCKVAYAKVMRAPAAMAPVVAPVAVAAEPEEQEDDLHERILLTAQGQRIVIWSIVAVFVLRAIDRSQLLPALLLELLLLGTALYRVSGVVKMCTGLGSTQNRKLLFMVLSFFPLINLILLAHLSVKATRIARDAGWRVGLFGARP